MNVNVFASFPAEQLQQRATHHQVCEIVHHPALGPGAHPDGRAKRRGEAEWARDGRSDRREQESGDASILQNVGSPFLGDVQRIDQLVGRRTD